MSFEIVDRDLAGRIGKLQTKRGAIETPLLLPVVNPAIQPISPEEMHRNFSCQAIIANAYLLKKNYGDEVVTRGIHDLLKFEGTIVTDSGGYQILVYGDVDVTPKEIVRFQEDIQTDIAVILDIPTGWNTRRERAIYTVDVTLKRAKEALNMLTRKDLLWVGPVQGGGHLDLISHSATEMGKLPFDIYALGSPTQVVERYLFDVLVDMIVAAKKDLPIEKPFHLFGAGHPLMFSLAVAMGCDIFDSAAYAIFARRGKYMTDYGTISLKDLTYFPCPCKVCINYTPQELSEMLPKERERLLAWHNLEVCFAEIKKVKQAIKTGRLWELLELRARGHPSMLQAVKRLQQYSAYLEVGTPISKGKGLFYYDHLDLARPEVFRYHKKIKLWRSPTQADVLVILPQPSSKPFHRSRELRLIFRQLSKKLGKKLEKIQICVYTAPYGVIPLELDETYPLSQFETASPPDLETLNYIAEQVEKYVRNENRHRAIILHTNQNLGELVERACRRGVGTEKLLISPKEEQNWSRKAINNLVDTIVHSIYNT